MNGGYIARMQLGMINAIINKNDKGKDLNKLLESFCDVRVAKLSLRQVIDRLTVNVPVSCTRHLCGLVLWN